MRRVAILMWRLRFCNLRCIRFLSKSRFCGYFRQFSLSHRRLRKVGFQVLRSLSLRKSPRASNLTTHRRVCEATARYVLIIDGDAPLDEMHHYFGGAVVSTTYPLNLWIQRLMKHQLISRGRFFQRVVSKWQEASSRILQQTWWMRGAE